MRGKGGGERKGEGGGGRKGRSEVKRKMREDKIKTMSRYDCSARSASDDRLWVYTYVKGVADVCVCASECVSEIVCAHTRQSCIPGLQPGITACV